MQMQPKLTKLSSKIADKFKGRKFGSKSLPSIKLPSMQKMMKGGAMRGKM